MACSIWGRKEGGMVRTDELFMLWAMLYNHPVNICYYLIDYLLSIARKKPYDKGDIVVGGIITFIARNFRVNMSKGINRIEGNYYLDLDTLTTMSFLRTHGPSHNYQYVWKVNRANCLIILPNSDITNLELVENLLYVGTNPQVHDDGGDEEEVGAHLHHEQEAGGNFNDERWAWMQIEVQRISTEQQRQGVEMAGLRNDVSCLIFKCRSVSKFPWIFTFCSVLLRKAWKSACFLL